MTEWTAPGTIIAIMTLLGVGHFAPKALGKLVQKITGGARRSREEVDRLRAALDRTNDELDIETAHRRRLQEALSQTRIVAAEHGVPVASLPTFPGRPEPA